MPLAFSRFLCTLRQYLNTSARQRPTRRPRFRPHVEHLEDLTLPSTLDITNGTLTYAGSAGVTGTVTVSVTGVAVTSYQFNDTAETITLESNGNPATPPVGWTGNGTHTVTGPTATVTGGFNVSLPSATDALAINGNISGTSVSLVSGQALTINAGNINSSGQVSLTASAGSIAEAGAGTITGTTLTTVSTTGTTLGNTNAVTGFNAGNTTSGNISLTNTTATLTVTGINEVGGGNVSVSNTGNLTTSGAVTTAANGNISLTATTGALTVGAAVTAGGSGSVTLTNTGAGNNLAINAAVRSGSGPIIGTSSGTISGSGTFGTTGTLTTSSVGGTTLNNANTVAAFNATNTTAGDVTFNNTPPSPLLTLTLTGVSQSGGGNVSITNTGNLATTGAVTVSGAGGITLTANTGSSDISVGAAVTSGSGPITLTAARNVTLTGVVATSGTATLTATTGAIAEGGAGDLEGGAALTTSSATGTNLGNNNAVNSFNATNTTSGVLSLVDQVAALTVTGISQFSGGAVDVVNSGTISLTGAVTAQGNGSVTLTTSGTISETGNGLIKTANLQTSSVGGTTLTGANGVVGTFSATNTTSGDIVYNDTAAIATLGVISDSGGGNIAITVNGNIAQSGTITATGAGNITLTTTGNQAGNIVTTGSILSGTNPIGTGVITLNSAHDVRLQAGTLIRTSAAGGVVLNGGPGATFLLNQSMLDAPNATLTGQGNNDTFNIALPTGTVGVTPMTINGGGPTSPVSVINSFQNQAVVLPTVGSVLNLSDASNGTSIYALSGTTFQRTSTNPTGLITYGTLSTVVFTTGTGTNTVDVASTLSQGNTTINSAGNLDFVSIATTGANSNNVFNGTGGNVGIDLKNTGAGSYNLLNAAANNNTFSVEGNAATALAEVNGGTGNDVTNIGNLTTNVLDAVLGNVNVNGQGSVVPGGNVPVVRSLPGFRLPALSVLGNVLNLFDQGSAAANNYALTPTNFQRNGSGLVTYTAIQTAQLNTGKGSENINVTSTAPLSNTTINAVAGAQNSIEVFNTGVVGNTQVNGGNGGDTMILDNNGANSFAELNGGGGKNTFVVRSATDLVEVNGGTGGDGFFAGNVHSSINQIVGGVDFVGGAHNTPVAPRTTFPGAPIVLFPSGIADQLTILDSGTTNGKTYAVASNVVQRGGAPLFYAQLTDLVLNAAQAGNAFNVVSTGTGMNTTINGNGVNNAFVVSTTGVGNNVFNAGPGSDSFRVVNTGAGSFNQFNGVSGIAAYVTATGQGSLSEVNSGTTALFASIGADTGANIGLLTNVFGTISVNGKLSAASDLLDVHDEINTTNTTYTLENLAFRHNPSHGAQSLAPIAFSSIASFIDGMGAGTDLMNILGTPAAQVTTLNGGGGADFFQIVGTSGKTSLTGGAAAANFVFNNGATLSGGSVLGRSGADQFNLSAYTSALRIDLSAGIATNTTTNATIATIAGVNEAIGGQGGNAMLGGTGNFVLLGGTGNDTMTAGTGTNVLYGNDHPGSVDTLNGSTGFTNFVFNSSADLTNGSLFINLGTGGGQTVLASQVPGLITPQMTYNG